MDGIHDLGGKQGFGPIVFSEAEKRGDYDPFPGEATRGWSLVMSATLGVDSPEGRFRFTRECIPPTDYLERPYADQWLVTILAQMIDRGSLTREEIETGRAGGRYEGEPPLVAADVKEVFTTPYRSDGPSETGPGFSPGDRVRARLAGSDGHTRMPAYVRGHPGVIHAYRGAHIYQDESAHFRGEHPMPLYTVRFESATLWPESTLSRDAVYVDLWEAHLESVE